MKKIISIEGMSCGHCKMRVENALNGIEGVSSATVDLDGKSATVELDGVGDDRLKEAVKDAGYEVTAVSEG